MAIQGSGITIAFDTSGVTANLISIDGFNISREALSTTHLGTVGGKTSIPSDVYEATVDVTFQLKPGEKPPFDANAETITITFPKENSGSVNAMSVAFTGYYTSLGLADMTVDDTVKYNGTIQVSGTPTWTVES